MEPLVDSSFGGEPAVPEAGPSSAFTVLFAPVKTFLGLAKRARIALPLVILLITTVISGSVVVSKIDRDEQRAQMREQFEKQGMAGQQLEQATDRAAGFMAKFGFVFPIVGAVFVGIMLLLFSALLLGGLKLAGAGVFGFKQALCVTVHASMPAAVMQLLTIPVALGREKISIAAANSGNILASNLGFLANENTSHALRALLGSVDLFSLWTVVLTALGGAIVGRVSRGAAGTVAVLLWILGVLIRVGFASLQP